MELVPHGISIETIYRIFDHACHKRLHHDRSLYVLLFSHEIRRYEMYTIEWIRPTYELPPTNTMVLTLTERLGRSRKRSYCFDKTDGDGNFGMLNPLIGYVEEVVAWAELQDPEEVKIEE